MKKFIFFARVYASWALILPLTLAAQDTQIPYPNYVVIGAFAHHSNAVHFTDDAKRNKFPAKFEMNPNRNLYYVYVLTTDDRDFAFAEALKLRTNTKYFDTWVYSGVLGELPLATPGDHQDLNPETGRRLDAVNTESSQQPQRTGDQAHPDGSETPGLARNNSVAVDKERLESQGQTISRPGGRRRQENRSNKQTASGTQPVTDTQSLNERATSGATTGTNTEQTASQGNESYESGGGQRREGSAALSSKQAGDQTFAQAGGEETSTKTGNQTSLRAGEQTLKQSRSTADRRTAGPTGLNSQSDTATGNAQTIDDGQSVTDAQGIVPQQDSQTVISAGEDKKTTLPASDTAQPRSQQNRSATSPATENKKLVTGSGEKTDPSTADRLAVTGPPPVKATTEPLSKEELTGKDFYFYLFRADNHETVPGEVDAIDFERSRRMATYDANTPVKVIMPSGKTKQISFICQVFGYRKLQKEFDPNNPAEDLYLDDKGNLVVPFELVRLQRGDIAIMYNVFFYKDAAVMRPESRYEVNNLLDLLVENPAYKIRIHGHTNGNASGKIIRMDTPENFYSLTGTKQGFGSAKQLSEERAIVIRQFLISSGISADRMEVKAWGGKKPIHDKHSVRANENVRVEIEILSD